MEGATSVPTGRVGVSLLVDSDQLQLDIPDGVSTVQVNHVLNPIVACTLPQHSLGRPLNDGIPSGCYTPCMFLADTRRGSTTSKAVANTRRLLDPKPSGNLWVYVWGEVIVLFASTRVSFKSVSCPQGKNEVAFWEIKGRKANRDASRTCGCPCSSPAACPAATK
jgi:hypothetical protein